MVVFVFAYVLVMKILYKLSRLAADWVRSLILCLGFVRRSFYFKVFVHFLSNLKEDFEFFYQLVYKPERPLKDLITVLGRVGLNLEVDLINYFLPRDVFLQVLRFFLLP